jgi:hypothetical protein
MDETIANAEETIANAEETQSRPWADWKVRGSARSAPPPNGGAVYGLGMIGALVYFAASAETPRDYLLAFGKSMVWPAILVYLAFKKLDV